VSASEIIKELPKLSEAERRAVLNKLRELAVRDEDVRLCEQAAELDRLEEAAADYRAVDLRSRGISEVQARDLRARLKTFAEDWERPEAAIYDEDPAR
jgi:uncharacterized protein (DUF169 family)